MGIPRRLLADDDERVVLAVRPHGKVLAGPVLVLVVLAPVTVVVAAFVPSGPAGPLIRLLVLGVGLLAIVRGAVVPFVGWRSTVYAVTTHRVVVRRGVLRRTGRDVPLARVVGLSFRTGAWDRLLGCGRVQIDAAGEAAPLVIDDVPAVEQFGHAVHRHAGLLDPAGDPEPGDDDAEDVLDEPDEAYPPGLLGDLDVPFEADEPSEGDVDDTAGADDEHLWVGARGEGAQDRTWRRRGRRGRRR